MKFIIIKRWVILLAVFMLPQVSFSNPILISVNSNYVTPVKKAKKVKSALKRTLFKLIKLKAASEGKGIGWVIGGAVLVTLLLGFFVFALLYGGATTLAAIVSVVGLGLIIFGSVKIIRSIKRRRSASIN